MSTAKPSVQLLEARQLLFATATSQGYGDGTGWVGHKEKARGPDQKEASILLCLSSFLLNVFFLTSTQYQKCWMYWAGAVVLQEP